MGTKAKIAFASLIFAVSYATRTLQAVDLSPAIYTLDQPFNGLTRAYHERAESILKGEGVLGPYDIDPSSTQWLAQDPGYSIFLSAIYSIFDGDFFTVQTIQNALTSLPPILIFLIAGTLLSWRVGVVAGLLAALSHHLAHFSNYILPDSLPALPLLAVVLILIPARGNTRPSFRAYVLAGVILGLSTWIRSQSLLMGPFLVVVLAIVSTRRRAATGRAAVMAAIALMMIAPITIRNYMVYGAFVPVRMGLGLNLWEGIGEAGGDRFGAKAMDHEVAAQEALLYNEPRYGGSAQTPDGIRRDRDRTRRSIAVIIGHPVWYAGVMARRMREMLKYSANAPLVYRIGDGRRGGPAARIRPGWEQMAAGRSSPAFGEGWFWMRPLIRPLQRMTKEVMLLFIFAGAAVLLATSWRRALLISMLPIYYLLFQSTMHTEFRFALPMHYFLFVFAAVIWVLLGTATWNGARRVLGGKATAEEPTEA
ncbi:MAG TPA: glycosyltransferase family 39 protein [Blastocatellia bacterium]|jgi:hypothetical protein|nr:glycosyltransferase family 39 protein [Blastocatellia bacterium]